MKHRQNLGILTFNSLLDHNRELYSHKVAIGFENEKMITYAEMHSRIDSMKQNFLDRGISGGDKIAILSNNSPEWVITYFAAVSLGIIVIPLLPDLEKQEINNILEHSGSRLLYVSEKLETKLGKEDENIPESVVRLEDGKLIKGREYLSKKNSTTNNNPDEEDIALIIYTSGTTGNSKGVMLTHKNLIANAIQGDKVQPVNSDDRFLSVLPLSHAYENTLGLLLAVLNGASVTYLSKPPTASVLLPALKRVKPTLMLTVPMIIEKIVKKKVFAKFKSSFITKKLYSLQTGRRILNYLAGIKIKKAFGSELKFFGIGGAKLDPEVERFLIDAKFPYAIGYGLTETAPLSAGSAPFKTRFRSTGPAVYGSELKISDGKDGGYPGEVLIKGPHVMKGYYKNPEMTEKSFTTEGFFRSGDLGIFDNKGRLYLRGRSKNLILGANGENIYPEDIESIINNYSYVNESLVVERKGKLVALVHFNREEIEEKLKGIRKDINSRIEEKLEELRTDLHKFVNSKVNKYSKVQVVVVHDEEFEKTATKKIKRFLYS